MGLSLVFGSKSFFFFSSFCTQGDHRQPDFSQNPKSIHPTEEYFLTFLWLGTGVQKGVCLSSCPIGWNFDILFSHWLDIRYLLFSLAGYSLSSFLIGWIFVIFFSHWQDIFYPPFYWTELQSYFSFSSSSIGRKCEAMC